MFNAGNIDLAHISLVEGDAAQEVDPFEKLSYAQVLQLCQRYYCLVPTPTGFNFSAHMAGAC